MEKVIDIADHFIKPSKIRWCIDIAENRLQELVRITQITAEGDILISVMTYSFDRIQPLREEALKELKEQLAKSSVKYVYSDL